MLRELLLLLHPFSGLFYRTIWARRYQKGKTSLDLNEARDDGVWGWQWHQLDHMQTICIDIAQFALCISVQLSNYAALGVGY